MNNKKTNQTRRNRGYVFETEIVKKFNDSGSWRSTRLGSPSTKLPDVMAINNFYKTIIAIEAKSTFQNLSYIPQDQVERCIDWVNQFSIYNVKQVVLAFKFAQIPGKRKLKYFYKVFPHGKIDACQVKGSVNGNTWIKHGDDDWLQLKLEDYKL